MKQAFLTFSLMTLLSCTSTRKGEPQTEQALWLPPRKSAKQGAQSFERSAKQSSATTEAEILLEPIPGRSVIIAWDKNPEPDVTGYRVYVEDDMTADVEDTTATLSALEWGNAYKIAVTAYNSIGESPRSEPITIEPPPLIIDGDFGNSIVTFNIQGWPGAQLDLQSSIDLVTWATEELIILDHKGQCKHTAPVIGSRGFWRIKQAR